MTSTTASDSALPLDVSSENYGTVAAQDEKTGADATTEITQPDVVTEKDAEKETVKEKEDKDTVTEKEKEYKDTVSEKEKEDKELDSDAEKELRKKKRNELTDEEFLRQKDGYEARVDDGEIWKHLLSFTPPFHPSSSFLDAVNFSSSNLPGQTPSNLPDNQTPTTPSTQNQQHQGKSKLDKPRHQTIQAAVSELYFWGKYAQVQEIVDWAKENYIKDKKFEEQVLRWEGRVRGKMDSRG